jgi:hypothetical protein
VRDDAHEWVNGVHSHGANCCVSCLLQVACLCPTGSFASLRFSCAPSPSDSDDEWFGPGRAPRDKSKSPTPSRAPAGAGVGLGSVATATASPSRRHNPPFPVIQMAPADRLFTHAYVFTACMLRSSTSPWPHHVEKLQLSIGTLLAARSVVNLACLID